MEFAAFIHRIQSMTCVELSRTQASFVASQFVRREWKSYGYVGLWYECVWVRVYLDAMEKIFLRKSSLIANYRN